MEKVIIERYSQQELQNKGVYNWPVWEKEVSRFDWYYDNEEHCLILEGEIQVEADGKTWQIRPGDYVVFQKGLSCIWDIKSPVRKHYDFIMD
ncbi:MAG: cupin domain-containing protein [Bacteroidales bacterium]